LNLAQDARWGQRGHMKKDPFLELATPLGVLIICFNELEVALGGALMRILKNSDEYVGAVFVSVLGFDQRYRLLKALAIQITDPTTRKEFLDLLEEARGVSERRNRFVHAEYTAVKDDDNETIAFLHQRLKDYSKESSFDTMANIFKYITPIDPEDLEELSNDASIIASRLLALSENFFTNL
jgi:Lon protease-like protein